MGMNPSHAAIWAMRDSRARCIDRGTRTELHEALGEFICVEECAGILGDADGPSAADGWGGPYVVDDLVRAAAGRAARDGGYAS